MAWYSLLDSGDIATSNPQAVSGAAAAAGASGQIADRDHVHAFAPTTTLDMGGQRLANLGAPVGANDAARKADVDAASAGVSPLPIRPLGSAQVPGFLPRGRTAATHVLPAIRRVKTRPAETSRRALTL